MSASAIELPSLSLSSSSNLVQQWPVIYEANCFRRLRETTLRWLVFDTALVIGRMRLDQSMCGSHFLSDSSSLICHSFLSFSSSHTFIDLITLHFQSSRSIELGQINSIATEKKNRHRGERKRKNGGKQKGTPGRWAQMKTDREKERLLLNRSGHTRTDQMHFN